MAAPLDGVSVIEIDNWMAAPSAAAILADLGADVIKIEPLQGDPMRGMGRPPKIPAGPAKPMTTASTWTIAASARWPST